MLRVGKSKLKALAAAAAVAAPALAQAQTNGTWTFNGSQTWSIVSNWASGTIATGGGNAVFPASSIGSTTIANVHLDTARTLGRVDFQGGTFTGSNGYAITGASPGTLTLNANTTINADSGTHSIFTAIIGNGTIIKTGAGTVIIASTATNNFNSNAIQVLDGVLVAASVNSLNGAVALATGFGGVIELGRAGSGSLNLSPGNIGPKMIGLGTGGGGGTLRNVNGNNSTQGTWFVLAAGSVNMVAGSLSLNGGIFDSDVGTLNGFTKAGSGTFEASQLVITGVLANTGGQFNLYGTGSSSVGTANITGGHVLQSNGTMTVINPMNVNGGGYSLLGPGRLIGNSVLTSGTYNISGGTQTGNITVNGGTFQLNGGAVNSVVTVNGGSATFTGNASLSTLAVNGGTARQVQLATPNTAGGRLTVKGITIAPSAKFDLTNNILVLDYTGGPTKANQMKQLLTNGFGGGLWNGNGGIVSGPAAIDANVNGYLAVGWLDNADLGSGNYPAASVIAKFAYYGDSELNGVVDLDDFNQFLFGYENGAFVRSNPQIWLNGDFDYSGLVDLDDFNIFLSTYTANLGSLGALSLAIDAAGLPDDLEASMLGAVAAAAVPEPATLAGLATIGAGLLLRRRRRD